VINKDSIVSLHNLVKYSELQGQLSVV